MEKQPVDDLFARKLRDADVTPGADVFGRLQSRINATPIPVAEPKRRLAGWWYGIAASTLLGLLWLSWPREHKVGKPAGRTIAQSGAASTRRAESKGKQSANVPEIPVLGVDDARLTIDPAEKKTRLAEPDEYVVQVKPRTRNNEPIGEPSQKLAVPDNVPTTMPIEAPVVANVERSASAAAEVEKAPTGRTVVLTIAEPEPAKIASVQPVKVDAGHNAPNLSQFFDKVKQIKSGEVFARVTPTRPAAEPKTGLGRLMNGVRESLRNENSLEP